MIERRVAQAVGKPVRSVRPVETRGYALAFHGIAEFEDGTTAFVKAGAEQVTSSFLRDELRFYKDVQASFMPALIGYDEGDPPFLVIEDLSEGHWPPPWDVAAVASVRDSLTAIWATPLPDWTPSVMGLRDELLGGWAEIERDSEPFLSLGLCTPAWLDSSLPALRAAAERAPLEGDALLHLDVRSDNICLADRGAVLVDWNWVHRGNPDVDLAGWASSLHLEGGPPPEQLLPGGGRLASAFAGFFGARAGLPPPQTAPNVRGAQRAQLEIALAWASRELALEWER